MAIFFWLSFAWTHIFHPFTFSLCSSLELRWVSWKEHLVSFCFCFVLFFNLKETYNHFRLFIFLCCGRGSSRRLKGENFCAVQFISKRIRGEAEGETESVLVALLSSDIVSSTCLLVSCRKFTLSFSLLDDSRYQSKHCIQPVWSYGQLFLIVCAKISILKYLKT